MQLINPNTHIDFIGRRKIAMAASGLLIALSIGLLIFKGLNFGIDFTGGTLVEVQFSKAPQISEIRESLTPAGYSQAIIQEFGSPEEIMIRVQNQDGQESAAISTAILDALGKGFGADAVEMRRVEFVGPQVGDELTRAGIMAVLIAMLAILVYVTVRFELRFALGADAALLHDVTIVLGLFALTGKEFTLPVVAALLTVIGYSLNDTIVVFDRIRENFAANRKKKHPDDESLVVNTSVNQTLSRTIMTSFTTVLVVFALFFLGGEVIHDFAFALIAGILVGTYSSIYIASPVMLAMHGTFKMDEDEAKRLEARP
ncbi:MAG: protein translocase subunit SecF [Zetaproteobacteria bacterium CG06_land_8_20_14_3_00_59_53]|nr:MAG: protein-export membrane protein SecF [Zetaproteobacteria bacterium CG2_30_59_37]PIO89437.1 MAG: protein translocase subunit SecF [Zetaproteobacteria bacterium CG23_combo_of_CG06-09_8_20_14_all_59_86]PIQ65463.1 MAG: protein translocase subunit SecF [Zetaproteobacteria bacterium CG11_big_fil_rev_8_21_14_0_20_59_439]PIU69716.1 MAG: protein translocase subunit SecF [Zetaproteobacteria bacterium CG06_land_8_20_14_3_00_59_53]PIU96963.1 MAG: protein translocase subunit SecF [Zetaproteobacteria